MRYLVFALLVAGACAQKRYDGHRLLTVFPNGTKNAAFLNSLELDNFEELDFWTDPSPVLPTDIRVSPNDFVKLRDMLDSAGISFTVSNENLQLDIDQESESRRLARARNAGLCNIYEEYCSYQQIGDLLANWAANSPASISVGQIGTGSEGRYIEMVRIASDLNVDKPAILVEAGTHAREWISPASALVLIDTLLSGTVYGNQMLEKFDWYIVPLHNPDGYAYSMTSDRYWRKNRSPCSGSWTGIDLNRNWDIAFGTVGTSSSCRDSIYGGQFAFEAPETAALRDAYLTIDQYTDVYAFFSIHSYSQMMIVPYAYTTTKPPNYNQLFNVAQGMMNALATVDGRYFQVGTAPDLLGAASGGADDYFLAVQGVPYSYTFELRPGPNQGLGGFVLPPEQIAPASAELVESLHYFSTTMDPFQNGK